MKTLLLLLVLSLSGCVDPIGRTYDDSPGTTFQYGQEVKIKSGFYRDYSCVVIREYEKGIFCVLYAIYDADGSSKLQEEFKQRVNISKSNVEEIK